MYTNYHTTTDQTVKCSWMDFHTDLYHLDSKGRYTIKVVKVYKPCVLVHKVNRRFVADELKDGHVISFKANQDRGLFPVSLLQCGAINAKLLKAIGDVIQSASYKDPVLEFRFL